MTTRRRRTGSETGTEEALSIKTASIISISEQDLAPINLWPQHSSKLLPSNLSTVDAYYKKTDTSAYPSHLRSPPNQVEGHWSSRQPPSNVEKPHTFLYSSPAVNHSSVESHFNPLLFSHSQGNSSVVQQESNASYTEIMASRDRTQEFLRIVRSQQGNLANGAHHLRDGRKPKDFRHYAEFMQRSKLIGRNISSTYAKLEKLTHLAKKRSLFDDHQDQEVQELTGIIRHDLTSLTKQLEDLQTRSRATSSLPSGNTGHLQKHSANLVTSLQSKVASIAQKFKDVLEVRTESLKKQAQRREQFAGGISTGELPPQAVTGHHQGSVLLADEAAAAAARSRVLGHDPRQDVAIDMGSIDVADSRPEGAVGGTVYEQQLQLMEEQDAYLQSRADTMKTIESTIVELGQMFTQLATMVKEQEELVHRIDSNVDEAELNVEAAHTELLKYFKSVSSNRWLMAKAFGIVVVFFIIFVVFMA